MGFRLRPFHYFPNTDVRFYFILFFYLQGREHEHLLLGAVYLLQQDGPARLLVQLGYSNCIVLDQNESKVQHCTTDPSCPGVQFLESVEQMCQVSHFWIQVKEDVVLEAEQQLVFVLDVLLHQGARRVQPPVNHSDIQHTE